MTTRLPVFRLPLLMMGAVLAYRALYYLVPLAGGLLLYFGLERYEALKARRQST